MNFTDLPFIVIIFVVVSYYLFMHLSLSLSLSLYICVCACMHACMHACVRVWLWAPAHVHLYACFVCVTPMQASMLAACIQQSWVVQDQRRPPWDIQLSGICQMKQFQYMYNKAFSVTHKYNKSSSHWYVKYVSPEQTHY